MGRVSVLIAVYNGVLTLEKSILSFLGQAYADKELIIVDGGSKDGTVEILRKYDADIHSWVSEPDRGIYHAWNKALELATGDWICFIGADDYWAYPDAIAELVSCGERMGAELVSGKVAIVDAKHEIKREWGKPWRWVEIKRHHCIAHPGMIHRRSCFDRNGLYDEKYRIAGDYDFSLRLGQSTKSAFLDKVVVCMGDSGVSHSMIMKTLLEVRSIQAKHPEIGNFRANFNFVQTLAVIGVKKAIGRL